MKPLLASVFVVLLLSSACKKEEVEPQSLMATSLAALPADTLKLLTGATGTKVWHKLSQVKGGEDNTTPCVSYEGNTISATTFSEYRSESCGSGKFQHDFPYSRKGDSLIVASIGYNQVRILKLTEDTLKISYYDYYAMKLPAEGRPLTVRVLVTKL